MPNTTEAHDTQIDVQAWDDAIRLLEASDFLDGDITLSRVGRAWRVAAADHLTQRLQHVLRDGLPMRAPASEAQFLAVLRHVGSELRVAGQELGAAAAQLRAEGRGYRAAQARQAHLRAIEVAESVVGQDG